jgi:hypothetical protein
MKLAAKEFNEYLSIIYGNKHKKLKEENKDIEVKQKKKTFLIRYTNGYFDTLTIDKLTLDESLLMSIDTIKLVG